MKKKLKAMCFMQFNEIINLYDENFKLWKNLYMKKVRNFLSFNQITKKQL
jgi:hypothetical protein